MTAVLSSVVPSSALLHPFLGRHLQANHPTSSWLPIRRTSHFSAGLKSRKQARTDPTASSRPPHIASLVFLGGSEVTVSACNARDLGSIPGSRRSPGEGDGNPLQYSCLENLMDGGAWWATVQGVLKESDRAERHHFHFHIASVGTKPYPRASPPFTCQEHPVVPLVRLLLVSWLKKIDFARIQICSQWSLAI